MFYLDTSFVVAVFLVEARTEEARKWIEQTPPEDVFISPWVDTEFSSAISLKMRTKQIHLEERAIILSNWRIFLAESAAVIGVDTRDFETAALFAANHSLALRAGDALHLAVAKSAGCTLVTLDKKMTAAALELGVEVAAVAVAS
jgi:uncharacterized protein